MANPEWTAGDLVDRVLDGMDAEQAVFAARMCLFPDCPNSRVWKSRWCAGHNKQRQTTGRMVPIRSRRKLTFGQAQAIRDELESLDPPPVKELCERYGVSHPVIWSIQHWHTYKTPDKHPSVFNRRSA